MDETDRTREDEWFRRNERQLIDAARAARLKREQERTAHEKEDERRRLREQHWMRCPKCGHELAEEQYGSVRVDRCTVCEGVYLDAGELEAILLKKEEDRRGLFRRLLKV